MLPNATNFREGNLLTPVCHSFHGGSLSKGVSVHGGSLSMGLSVSRGVSVYRGVSVWEGLCPGAGGGVSDRGTPPYGNMRGVSYWNELLFFVILDSQPQG